MNLWALDILLIDTWIMDDCKSAGIEEIIVDVVVDCMTVVGGNIFSLSIGVDLWNGLLNILTYEQVNI